MPPFVVPPLMKLALGAVGAAAVVHWVVREVKRINEELERDKAMKLARPVRDNSYPTLRRDPRTGDYRPQR